MADVPDWLLGRQSTVCTLTGAALTTPPTIADATGAGIQVCLTFWDEVDLLSEPEVEEIHAASAARQHNVILSDGWGLRLTQILRRTKATGEAANNKKNPIIHIITTYDIIKLNFTVGPSAWEGYFCRGRFEAQYRRGKSIGVLQALALDSGALPTHTES